MDRFTALIRIPRVIVNQLYRPLFQIYWHDGDGHVMVKNVRTTTTLLEDGKRYTA